MFVLETKQMPGRQRLGDMDREGRRKKEKGGQGVGEREKLETGWEGPAGAQEGAGTERAGETERRRDGGQSRESK